MATSPLPNGILSSSSSAETERVLGLARAAGFFTAERQAVLSQFCALARGEPPTLAADEFARFVRARGLPAEVRDDSVSPTDLVPQPPE
jgi:hypothetical protein